MTVLPHNTFCDHVSTCRHRSRDHLIAQGHFLLVVLWNESLNPAIFEILRSKRIGVKSLTYQGHVTSSVT